MIKAIIVDDEPRAIEMVSILAKKYISDLEICATCQNVKDSIEKIKLHEPDILFLDVELSDGLGFEVLENVEYDNFRTIFTTAHEHYALKAIKFHAFDYLLKPIIPQELEKVLKKVVLEITTRQKPPDTKILLNNLGIQPISLIAVPSRNGLHYYNLDDIVSIEANGNYTNIYLVSQKKVLISRKMKDFENILAGRGFLRVHKSHMINMNHIMELHRDDSGYLLMSNGEKVPISARDKEDIISLIKQASNLI